MKITLNNAKGKRLKTAKSVIRENIEVVPVLEKKNINANGTYPVGDGYAGIGEVVVNVTGGGSNAWAGVFSDDKTYHVGDIVYYEGGIYERTKYSTMVQLPTNEEYWKLLAILVGGGTDSAIPIEVSTEAEMTALLTSGEVGGVYKYTGTTGTYENGALYVLEVCE